MFSFDAHWCDKSRFLYLYIKARFAQPSPRLCMMAQIGGILISSRFGAVIISSEMSPGWCLRL